MDQVFANVGAVSISGIDEIYIKLWQTAQNPQRFFAVRGCTPDAFPRNTHSAKTQAINRKIAAELESSTGTSSYFRHVISLPVS